MIVEFTICMFYNLKQPRSFKLIPFAQTSVYHPVSWCCSGKEFSFWCHHCHHLHPLLVHFLSKQSLSFCVILLCSLSSGKRSSSSGVHRCASLRMVCFCLLMVLWFIRTLIPITLRPSGGSESLPFIIFCILSHYSFHTFQIFIPIFPVSLYYMAHIPGKRVHSFIHFSTYITHSSLSGFESIMISIQSLGCQCHFGYLSGTLSTHDMVCPS